ncbi:MAG: DnaA regulatory inactivator Hda [Sterolibacteriaceae bacterium MAG5]|nr:DnaA regulatory inactivator Hda [Candidatus Nitricoxidireducens bremensis]
MTQLILDLKPEQIPSLDNFVAGANAELVGRLRAIAVPGGFDMIYVWGPPGSGRSHLLAAVAQESAPRRPTALLAGAAVGTDLTLPPGGLVIIDDVETLSADAQQALFRTFNSARLVGLSLLLSGPVPPLHLELREDLRTRIGQALIYEVKALDDDEKSAALRRHAMLRGMRVEDGLVQYLLRHGRRDLPSLMAVLDGLDRASLQQKRPATLPLLREVMQLQLETDNDEAGSV